MMESLQPRGQTRELFATRSWRPRMETRQPELRIVSGGQTGVDRAALDAALALGLAVGGWCPRGRVAENGEIPARYPLVETESERYPVRTRLNVTDSDATLILARGAFDNGTRLTADIAQRSKKPYLVVELDAVDALERTRAWLAEVRPHVLNIAGPRESKQPGIYGRSYAFLSRLLKRDS